MLRLYSLYRLQAIPFYQKVAKSLLDRMINRGGSKHMLLKQIVKAFNRHLETF